MANVIKLKRGSGSDPSASDLVIGEVAVRTDTGKLFTKKDNGTIAEISGAGGSDIFINTLSASSGSGGGSATFNGTATRFTLSNPPDVSAQQLLVSVNGVVQKPNAGTSPSTGFAVDGNDIIFAAAPETGASFFIVTYGTIGLGIPADNSVTTGKIADGTIVNADVNASAAIAGSKINPNFGSQDISTTGNLTLYGTNPTISFTDSNEDSDFRLFINAGKFKIQDASNSNADRFTVFTDGHIDIPGNLNCASGLDVTGEITATSHIDLPDDARIKLGTGDDLEIYHDGSNSYLLDGGTGSLLLATNGTKVGIITSGGVAIANFNNNSSCQLFHAGSRKFQTSSSGIDITGNIVVSGTVDGVDIATRDTLFGGLTSSSGVLTDGVTATTQGASDNTTKVATTAYVTTAIGNLINGAPSALDTLNELAAAMNDDAAFSTTVTNSLATKMPLAGGTFTGDVTFNGANYNVLWDKSDNALEFADNAKAVFGAGSDLQIYHDSGSANSFIKETGAGSLIINANDFFVQNVASETMIKGASDGAVELYYDNSKKFETTSAGVTIEGSQHRFKGDIRFDNNTNADKDIFFDESENRLNFFDDVKATFGNSDDLQIYHDGSNSYVKDAGTGELRLASNVRVTDGGANTTNALFVPEAQVELYYNNSKKFETTTNGIIATGNDAVGNILIGDLRLKRTSGDTTYVKWDASHSKLEFMDSVSAMFGDGNDLEIFHNGSNSFIRHVGTGNLHIKPKNNEEGIVLIPDGAIELYHNNSKTVETHANGITFSHSSGNLIKYGSTSEFPNAAININRGGNGYANIRLSSNYGCGLFMAGANDNTDEFAINQDNQKVGYLDNRGGAIKIATGSSGLTRLTFENSYTITSVCDFVPSSNNSKDLGSSSLRWANVYTNDLNLSNEGGANDVDGTWGSYTIQEGAEDLFLVNKRNGKKYKFNLTEVS